MVSRNLERANENDGFKMTALECAIHVKLSNIIISWAWQNNSLGLLQTRLNCNNNDEARILQTPREDCQMQYVKPYEDFDKFIQSWSS